MVEAAWLIPAFPLAGFLFLMAFGRRLGEPVAGWVATAAIGGSFLSTVTVFLGLVAEEPDDRFFIQKIFTWVPSGSFVVDLGFLVDPLSITMCLFITGVGTLIHLYSVGYMHGDEDFSKFFVYLNAFAASMLLLVLGDNLLLTYLGWEGVGTCSYLLISFWFTSESNASAGKKAFVTNRIGDFTFALGTFVIFGAIGSIRYADIMTNQFSSGIATAAVVLFLIAATSKSAQIPLFVWLPDAMAGPTPVSALIHAATMVTSGVYLLTRLNPLLAQADPWSTTAIAWVGAITALLAALAAIVQTDIKKVLAYSTVSQLGYLFLAIGVGGYVPAIFHMVTHAFFKALLFLGSGSVIHGLHDEQDMRRMGGLTKFMPITAGTFIVGWLAIAGVPPFSGFWSKDEILLYAWNESPVLWAIGLITAILTAFYMTRQVVLTFFGRTRFFDVHQDEIESAFGQAVIGAEAEVFSAEEAVLKAEEAMAKADEDVTKKQLALTKATDSLGDAQAAVSASTPDADDHAKLVKALDKADKAVPKAVSALEKSQAKLIEATQERSDALVAVDAAKDQVRTAAASVASAPREPEFVTALTPAIDVSDFEDQLPDSYRHRQEYHPHESPWTMTAPLVILAGLAAAGGLLNLPFSHNLHFLANWLEPMLFGNEVHVSAGAGTKIVLALIATGCAIGAVAVSLGVYLKGKADPAAIERKELALAIDYDNALAAFMGGPGRETFERASWFDGTFIDGAVNGVASAARQAGRSAQSIQTGFVRSYAFGIVAGSAAVVLWFLVRLWS